MSAQLISLAAKLTQEPCMVYSARVWPPATPSQTSPVVIPIVALYLSLPSMPTSATICVAAVTALEASSHSTMHPVPLSSQETRVTVAPSGAKIRWMSMTIAPSSETACSP